MRGEESAGKRFCRRRRPRTKISTRGAGDRGALNHALVRLRFRAGRLGARRPKSNFFTGHVYGRAGGGGWWVGTLAHREAYGPPPLRSLEQRWVVARARRAEGASTSRGSAHQPDFRGRRAAWRGDGPELSRSRHCAGGGPWTGWDVGPRSGRAEVWALGRPRVPGGRLGGRAGRQVVADRACTPGATGKPAPGLDRFGLSTRPPSRGRVLRGCLERLDG